MEKAKENATYVNTINMFGLEEKFLTNVLADARLIGAPSTTTCTFAPLTRIVLDYGTVIE